MVADAEPNEIHLSLLSHDEGREHNYDIETLRKGLKQLNELERVLTIYTFVIVATILLGGWYGVTIPIPLYDTLRVFGCFGWILASVLFMVFSAYSVLRWWKINNY